jgi:hypothetical protein
MDAELKMLFSSPPGTLAGTKWQRETPLLHASTATSRTFWQFKAADLAGKGTKRL